MEGSHALVATEAELLVQAIQKYNIKDIGSGTWAQQHEHIERLNMQAVVSASQQEDEYIKEFLITYEKIPTLIYELIATETWKQHVFPEIVNMGLDHGVMFPIYMVLYHEATVANLLETTMYHQDTTEAAEDSALDLLDYCYRKLTYLVAIMEAKELGFEEEETDIHDTSAMENLEELERQDKKLNFDVSIKAVSILRYITDHLPHLPLSVTTRLLNTHDVPVLLVQLITSPPWTRTKDGQLQKYVDNKWQNIDEADRYKLTKIEGQVWLSLYQLLLSEDCMKKYELSPFRKNIILKLRNLLMEVVLDQLPVLADLQRYLEQLSLMDPPPVKQDLILEQVPEIRDSMLRAHDGKWEKIAKKQIQTFFNPKKMDMKAQAARLAATYNMDMLESMISEPPKCALCGAEASKRCSRCQNEWYCRRECQVNHWKKHKKACDLLMDALKKTDSSK